MKNLYSLENKKRFRANVKIDHDSGCWLWTGGLSKGYAQFYLPEIQYSVRAHKWLWELINGPVPKNLELDHLCNTQRCVNPAHLEPVTHLENMQRASKRGVWQGERNANSKLNENQVLAIRILNQYFQLNGLQISQAMKMKHRNIYFILKNESWKNVKLPKNLKSNARSFE